MKRVPFTVVMAVPAAVAVSPGEFYLAWSHGHGRDVIAQRAQAVREAQEDFADAYGVEHAIARFATAVLVIAGHHRDVADSLGGRQA